MLVLTLLLWLAFNGRISGEILLLGLAATLCMGLLTGKYNANTSFAANDLRGKNAPGKLLREYAMLDRDLSEPCDIENATGSFMLLRSKPSDS